MDFITSRENKKVKDFVKLAKSKSYRDQTKCFAVEGVKLILEAFQSHVPLEMVFITNSCFEKNKELLQKLFQTDCGVIITDEISDKMTQQSSPQGIYAICKKLDNPLCTDTIYHSGKFLMLCDLQDSGNVGTIIRTAEAVGINGVIITKNSCDIYSLKTLRGSMGAIFRMPILTVESEIAFLTNMAKNNVKTYASVLDEGAEVLSDITFANPAILLIGNEGNGLSNEVKKLCNSLITIKMLGNAESLNASMAACILMWEMVKN